jgi:hypothetical protein
MVMRLLTHKKSRQVSLNHEANEVDSVSRNQEEGSSSLTSLVVVFEEEQNQEKRECVPEASSRLNLIHCLFLLAPVPVGDRDCRIGSNFCGSFRIPSSKTWTFRTFVEVLGFQVLEPVSLVKVFRLFKSEPILLVFRVWTQHVDVPHIIYWQGQCVCDAFLVHWPIHAWFLLLALPVKDTNENHLSFIWSHIMRNVH